MAKQIYESNLNETCKSELSEFWLHCSHILLSASASFSDSSSCPPVLRLQFSGIQEKSSIVKVFFWTGGNFWKAHHVKDGTCKKSSKTQNNLFHILKPLSSEFMSSLQSWPKANGCRKGSMFTSFFISKSKYQQYNFSQCFPVGFFQLFLFQISKVLVLALCKTSCSVHLTGSLGTVFTGVFTRLNKRWTEMGNWRIAGYWKETASNSRIYIIYYIYKCDVINIFCKQKFSYYHNHTVTLAAYCVSVNVLLSSMESEKKYRLRAHQAKITCFPQRGRDLQGQGMPKTRVLSLLFIQLS